MSRHRRTARLEEEHARRNPPKLTPPIRVVQDGERVERLDGLSDPVPPGAFLVVREIVDPPPADGDLDPPPGGTLTNTTATAQHLPPMPEPAAPADEQAPPAELSLAPDPPPPTPRLSRDQQRRAEARESFERRSRKWNDQLKGGLGRPAKKRLGVDQAPNEHAELKQAAKEGRVRVRGFDFLGSKPM